MYLSEMYDLFIPILESINQYFLFFITPKAKNQTVMELL
jgi:hypothetical protein